jgi:TRAP-type C4-dicarboxylate transport system permease small subunit
MTLTTIDVVLRYILGNPLKGAYEVSEILMLSAAFLGMAYTQLFREHVNADLFVKHLPQRVNLVLETVMLLLALLIYSLLVWQGTIAFWESFTTGEYRWGVVRIPLWQARLMVPLGIFFLCLRFLWEIIVNFRKLFGWK